MELWHGDLPDLVESTRDRSLVPQMVRKFERIHSSTPSPAEVKSWELSLKAMSDVADGQGDDVGVSVEYHLPLSGQRIDVVFTGRDDEGQANALVVELKHWDDVSIEDKYTLNVLVGDAEHLHPSQQAAGYVDFLKDIHGAFVDAHLTGYACAFCHELDRSDGEVLRDPRFDDLLALSPLFQKGDEDALGDYLRRRVGGGEGLDVLDAFRKGRFKPSRKVIDCLANVIQRDERWHLLERQQLAYNAILAQVQRAVDRRKRAAVLVRGGPGTGKTVIAVQLLADVLRMGCSAAHSTGGKAFTTAMRATFRGADKLFIWNMSTRNAVFQELDLLLVDEAHRIRENSDTRFTRARDRNRKSQVDELLDAAKVVVFFLDENQFVRPDEVGRSTLVQDAASALRIPLREYDLATQFRCGGCVEYVQWVDHLLGFRASPPDQGWKDRFRFTIAGDPEELDDLLEHAEASRRSARLLAGFGWRGAGSSTMCGLVLGAARGTRRGTRGRTTRLRTIRTPSGQPRIPGATRSAASTAPRGSSLTVSVSSGPRTWSGGRASGSRRRTSRSTSPSRRRCTWSGSCAMHIASC